MESITELGREYNEINRQIDHVRRAIPENPSNRAVGEDYLERLERKADDIWKKIEAFRRSAHNRVGYTIRSVFTESDSSADFDRQATLFRSCMRSATQAEKAGNRSKADQMRAKAKEYVEEMSRIRRSGHRTISTPTGLKIKNPPVPTSPKVRGSGRDWCERHGKQLDEIEKRLNNIGERLEALNSAGDDSLRIKRPTGGPVKR